MPRARTSAGREAVDLARSAGLVLDAWQEDVLIDSLGEGADGRWAAMECCICMPRQNGKGVLLEARELAGLFLFGEELIIHSAHLFDTSLEAFRRILARIQDTPDFDRHVKRVSRSHGEEGIELRSGQRLRFKTRTAGGGRGLTGDVVILDEAYNLPPEAMAALIPTLSAKKNPQVWYASSAPMASSTTLRNLCTRGRAGTSKNLAYFEWCAADDAESGDRQAWADANPGLGIRLSEGFTQTELESLEEDTFRRERLGIWFPDDVEHVIPEEVWSHAADPGSKLVDPVAFAVDVTTDRGSAAIAVAGLREDGRRHVEVVQQGRGTRWLTGRLAELCEKWTCCAVALDATSPAASLIPELERKLEVPVVVLGASDLAKACGSWFDAMTSDQMRHMDQPPLNAALFGARKRPIGDMAWRWSRKDSSVDISPLTAATLADHAFQLHGLTAAVAPWFAFGYDE